MQLASGTGKGAGPDRCAPARAMPAAAGWPARTGVPGTLDRPACMAAGPCRPRTVATGKEARVRALPGRLPQSTKPSTSARTCWGDTPAWRFRALRP